MIDVHPDETKRVDTKTRILDTAERLFGDKGFEATSLRDITSVAQVNLAAVNYHFQSKDSLIDAVIARRIEPVNKKRIEMLDAAGSSPTIEQVVEAFLLPVVERPATAVVQMIGRMLATPDQFRDRVFARHFEHIAIRFREAMARARPDLSEAERVWRFHFMAGVMSHVLCFAQVLPQLSGGLCDFSDPHQVAALMKTFLVGGFRAATTGTVAEKS